MILSIIVGDVRGLFPHSGLSALSSHFMFQNKDPSLLVSKFRFLVVPSVLILSVSCGHSTDYNFSVSLIASSRLVPYLESSKCQSLFTKSKSPHQPQPFFGLASLSRYCTLSLSLHHRPQKSSSPFILHSA